MFKLLAIASLAVAAAHTVMHRSRLREQMSAEVAMRSLLRDIGTKLTRDIHKGMRLPLNQEGYELSLGNVQMTAFILRFAEAYGFEIIDANALQGFVMHYNGYCTKRSYADLVWELGSKTYRQECKPEWVREVTDESFLQIGRTVTRKEFEAFQFKENMMHRAAAFDAAMAIKAKDPPMQKLRRFVKGFVMVLNGKIASESRFSALVESLATAMAGAKELENEEGAALDLLAETLYDDSEGELPAVSLRALESRQVDGIEDGDDERDRPEWTPTGIGQTAPITEAGYQQVYAARNNADMAVFANRTAIGMGFEVVNSINLNAFAPWFSGRCGALSLGAMQAELRTMQFRAPMCGGGWIQQSPTGGLLLSSGQSSSPGNSSSNGNANRPQGLSLLMNKIRKKMSQTFDGGEAAGEASGEAAESA